MKRSITAAIIPGFAGFTKVKSEKTAPNWERRLLGGWFEQTHAITPRGAARRPRSLQCFTFTNQNEPSFEELDVAETEELAENDQGEPGEVVKMRDESKNGKGLGEA